MSAIWVEITGTRGSAPRDAGTAMKVTATDTQGTIGGGALEHRAIDTARRMIVEGTPEATQSVPLGPGLGQCCGGSVTLRFDRQPRPTDAPAPGPRPDMVLPDCPVPLWLWGAGHVGRAVVAACPPRAFDITWIDTAPDRFPSDVRQGIDTVTATDMPRLAASAPREAHHLIFTYSHDIDLALCAALLRRGFASCGLIGSATKWARFQSRLRAAGLDPAPIRCPIGDKSRGKHPGAIAAGVVDAYLHEGLPA